MENIKTIITNSELNQCKDALAMLIHYEDVSTYLAKNIFMQSMVKKIPALYYICNEQINKQKTIQDGLLVETVAIATLAQQYNLTLDINSIYSENHRFAYYNEDKTYYILQCGDPNSPDVKVNLPDYCGTMEIKDSDAKLGEYDLVTDETGYFISSSITNTIIRDWVKSICWFDNIGHNIKMPIEVAINAAKQYLNNYDYLIAYNAKTSHIKIFSYNEALMYILNNSKTALRGSEIRTTGRNWVKSKTCNTLLKNNILNAGGHINANNIVEIPENALVRNSKERSRNGTVPKWVKFASIFRIDDKDIINRHDGFISIQYKDIKQNKPTISAHIHF